MSIDAMLEKVETKFSFLSDLLLPYAVKDIRQSIRSKIFTGFFFLGFFVAAIVAFWVGLEKNSDRSEGGLITFMIFNVIMDVGVLLVLPVLATQVMNQERNDNSFELQQISSSTPFRIIMGKWQSGVVQSLFFYFMILPFVSFSYVLKGVTISQIICYSLISIFASQFLLCISVLASSSSDIKKIRQGLSFLIVLGSVGLGITIMSMKGGLLNNWARVDRAFVTNEFWIWFSAILGLILLVEGFLFSISVARLSSYGSNKSLGPKIFFISIMMYLMALLYFVFMDMNSGRSRYMVEPFYIFGVWMYVILFVIGTFFLLEDDSVSRRQFDRLNRTPKALVFFVNLFYPGRSSAICLLVFMCTSLLVFLLMLSTLFSLEMAFANIVYINNCALVYLAVFYFVGYYLKKFLGKESPRLVYGSSVLLISLIFIVLPYFIGYGGSIFHLFNFIDLVDRGFGRSFYLNLNNDYSVSAIFSLSITAVLAVFIWVFARIHMKRQIRLTRNYEAGERGI